MKIIIGLMLSLWLAGCSDRGDEAVTLPQYGSAQGEATLYRFAIHPLHNPEKLHAVFSPLMRHLDAKIPGVHFDLEASKDYAAFEQKLRQREVAFALPNPYQTLLAERSGYQVIAKMGNDADFRGIFLVRRDSGIREVVDLKGRVVAYPAPTALAAAMLPQHFLHTRGLNVTSDIENRYVGSQESSILAVYHRQAAAAATWPPPWRAFQKSHPKEAAELEIAWQTPSLPNNAFVARDDIPGEIVAKVRAVLAGLHESPEGRAVLAAMETQRVDAADTASYAPVRRFVAEFNAQVRPIETYAPTGEGARR